MSFLVTGHQGKLSFSPIKSVQINFSPIVCLTKIFVERVVEGHQEKLVKLLDLFVEHVHNKFNKYAFYFFMCELLNVIITVFMVSINIIIIIEYIFIFLDSLHPHVPPLPVFWLWIQHIQILQVSGPIIEIKPLRYLHHLYSIPEFQLRREHWTQLPIPCVRCFLKLVLVFTQDIQGMWELWKYLFIKLFE